jgi:hypothetical protein
VQLRKIFLDTPTVALQYLGPALTGLFLAAMSKHKHAICLGLCSTLMGGGCYEADRTRAAEAMTFSLTTNPLVGPALSFLLFWHSALWFMETALCVLYVRKTGATDSYARLLFQM